MVNIVGNHDGSSAVDYTVNPATGFPWATGPTNLGVPFNHLLPAWDAITGTLAAAGVLAAERHRRLQRRGPAGAPGAVRRGLRHGRATSARSPRCRSTRTSGRSTATTSTAPSGGTSPPRTASGSWWWASRPGSGRTSWRPPASRTPAPRSRSCSASTCRTRAAGSPPGRSSAPSSSRGSSAAPWPRWPRSSTPTTCAGVRTRRSPSWSRPIPAARPRTRCSTSWSSPASATYLMPGSPLAFGGLRPGPARPGTPAGRAHRRGAGRGPRPVRRRHRPPPRRGVVAGPRARTKALV